MTRSPLAYPLNRAADMDAGGAADLQTDIMRFMAILSLCLVAIFALVQSIPMNPVQQPAEQPVQQGVQQRVEAVSQPEIPNAIIEKPRPESAQPPELQVPRSITKPIDENVTLTRPKWIPKYSPSDSVAVTVPQEEPAQELAPEVQPGVPAAPVAQAVESEVDGFTLRFESDAALTRLVASSRIGVYAIAGGRAQRMTVSDSRISFWDASTPNTFHEMEAKTVPSAVIEALARSGADARDVRWGVTLPGRLKSKLDELMQVHDNGALVIISSGDIQWEAS